MTSDLTALLERLPEIKALDLAGVPRWKKWELTRTAEQRAKRNAQKRARWKALKGEKKAQQLAKGRARAKKWYEEHGKLDRHGL